MNPRFPGLDKIDVRNKHSGTYNNEAYCVVRASHVRDTSARGYLINIHIPFVAEVEKRGKHKRAKRNIIIRLSSADTRVLCPARSTKVIQNDCAVK